MNKIFVAVFAALVSVTALAGPASGILEPDPNATTESSQAATQPDPSIDSICVRARKADARPGNCATGSSFGVGTATALTSAELKDYGYLTSVDGSTTLATGTLSATVYCNTWWQDQHGLYYVNWKEKHTGRFCYNGRDVWIGVARGGYHRCDQGYGIGYDIEVKNCVENKIYVNTRPGYGFQNWDYYRVHVIWRGIPLYASHDMHANVYPSGNVYYY